jgi:hypothetical protein
VIDVWYCGALYRESREGIARMRDEGRPPDYAERTVGRIGMSHVPNGPEKASFRE